MACAVGPACSLPFPDTHGSGGAVAALDGQDLFQTVLQGLGGRTQSETGRAHPYSVSTRSNALWADKVYP